jgi:hypothetical protein
MGLKLTVVTRDCIARQKLPTISGVTVYRRLQSLQITDIYRILYCTYDVSGLYFRSKDCRKVLKLIRSIPVGILDSKAFDVHMYSGMLSPLLYSPCEVFYNIRVCGSSCEYGASRVP